MSLESAGVSEYPSGAVPVMSSSGVVANNPAFASLPAVAGKTTFITGFIVTGLGATAANTVDVQIAGPTQTLHFAFSFPAGATVPCTPLQVTFGKSIPAAAVNSSVVVSVPASGAGGTNCTATAWGYQL